MRNHEVYQNVAGIEIESSVFADVYENNAHDNTAGVLVFSLPQLQVEGGHDVRVFNNTITGNDTESFAAMGDLVHIVPAGTGSFVMACSRVEVFDNTFATNNTGANAIISYLDAELPINDSKDYPYPSNVFFHDNKFSGNGTSPTPSTTA